jgi:predicted porin
MFGGLTKAGWATILVSGGLMLGTGVSAQAADLGGDCCADLEERIAELEATAVRKGNRKVSLKINGWVNEQILFWDDGHESNIYIGNNDQERSRFKFSGSAKINGDVSAGYVLEIGVRTTRSSAYRQDNDEGATGLDIRKSAWFIKSKTYGTLTVGREGSATYHILDDANITNTRYYADAESLPTVGIAGFLVTTPSGTSGITWSSIMSRASNNSPGNGERPDIIRYSTPEYNGFSAVAAYGEDDMWDAAVIFEKEIGDFEMAFRVGYAEYTDESGQDHCFGADGTLNADSGQKCREWGGSGTIWHKPTGLYVYGAYGQKDDNRNEDVVVAGLPQSDNTDTLYYVQAGIEKKWHPLGSTSIFMTYRHDDVGTQSQSTDNDFGPAGLGLPAGTYYSQGAEINTRGGGVVQNIAAAAMDVYLIYQHVDGEFDAVCRTGGCGVGTTTKVDLETFQLFQAGARIQF